MPNAVPSSSAGYGAGHWSDGGAHDDGAFAAAAASDVFRDFTWYSAMLLSHLFTLEHAQLMREAAVEETRRRTASAHSPQLLMRAAMAAANAPATPTSVSDATQPMANAAGTPVEGEDAANVAEDGGATAAKLPHLTTHHRPHILLGFTVGGGGNAACEEAVVSDPATQWSAPSRTEGDAATASLLAVFDAFYFPSELFPRAEGGETAGTAGTHATSGTHAAHDGAPSADVGDDDEDDGSVEHGRAANRTGATHTAESTSGAEGGSSGGGGGGAGNGNGNGAPRVTPEALRDAFHTLLLLGQRCAAFALTFHGIIGANDDGNDGDEAALAHHADTTGFLSSEDESRSVGGGGVGGGDGGSGRAAMQQAASAALQFLLQLSCSCPCAPLSYAAQLCLAHALAVQPAPRSPAGWAARQQLLRFLPTLQPPSRALMAEGAGTGGHHLHQPHQGSLSNTSSPASTAVPTAPGGPSTAARPSGSNGVPATQYVCAEDPMLWFDAAGVVHVATAQQWWEGGQVLSAYCGPLPATTALPTVQRLLMEEEQYTGPNGSAAAVLQSVLAAVATEVTLNARVLPGGASSLVHNSLRRRRGVHGGGSSSSSSSSSSSMSGMSGGMSGSPRGASSATMPRLASPTSGEASAEWEAGAVGSTAPPFGAPTLNTTSTTSSSGSGGGAGLSGARAAGPAVSATSRLSKAAKRRRALLFALAQSHLLPPTLQLATSKTLLYGVFTEGGECPSYYMLLSLYPDILRAHHASLHYVLFEEGPLSVDVRLMVATMAASRHRCEYLVSRFSALLLRYAEEAMLDEREDDYDNVLGDNGNDYDSVYRGGGGGGGRHGVHSPLHDPHNFTTEDERGNSGAGGGQQRAQAPQLPYRGQARLRWITHGPPSRLHAVQHLIAITAHTPWTLHENDIRAVLAAGWTIPEIFQLVAIVAQVVPLCSFVMGMFVPAEPWTMTLLPLEVVELLGHRAVTEEAPTAASGSAGGMVSSGSSGALSGLRRPSNMPGEGLGGACLGPATPHHAASGRSLLGTATSGSDMAGMLTMTGPGGTAGNTNSAMGGDVYRRYAGEDSIVSEQRIKGGSGAVNPHTLWRSQFTWNEVGATSMEQYYPGAATLMSEEMECFFDVVRQLTKADCVGLMSPDYAPSYAFRSLQLYVQNLLGFMVEDYPYNDINKVLRRPAKWFAQVLTMRPETLTRSEVVRWYVPTTPPTGKPSDMSAESSLGTHQLKREIELLSVVDSAQGGHRGGIESASAHPDQGDNLPPTPLEAARDAAEAEALQTALTLQDERVLLLIALATMEARKEGLLHILLRPVCSVLSNM